ncbi:MAG: hypothetical protein ACOCTR_04095 [Candidatus Natronoplasma sp.]
MTMGPLLGLGLGICLLLLILVVIVLIIAFFLKMLIQFLPATLLAILVFIFTRDLLWTIITFVAVAFVLSVVDWARKK